MLFRIYEDDWNRIRDRPEGVLNVGVIHEARCVKQGNEPEMLQEALLGLHHFNATDPRDKVFAILGLVVDAEDEELQPDYDASVRDVHINTARHLFLRDSSILILHKAGIGSSGTLKDLPSWVPDWTGPNEMCFGGTVRTSGYRAGLDISARVRPGPTKETLLLQGMAIDQIKDVGTTRPRAPSGGDDKVNVEFIQKASNWLLEVESVASKIPGQTNRARWPQAPYPPSSSTRESQTLYEAFWRTLIANACLGSPGSGFICGPVLSEVGGYYQSYCKIALGLGRSIYDGQTISNATSVTQSNLFSRAHTSATEGRKFFVTQRGFMGLGNQAAEVGDLVVVLAGGVTPFVLRRDGVDLYRLVGEAYVHGLMEGKYLKAGWTEDFVLY